MSNLYLLKLDLYSLKLDKYSLELDKFSLKRDVYSLKLKSRLDHAKNLHNYMKTEAWAQEAANHGLGSHPLSSVGELSAGAGAGGAAVRSPGVYNGGSMFDEHDRLAIRAIIQHHMPKSLTVAKIAQLAGLPAPGSLRSQVVRS